MGQLPPPVPRRRRQLVRMFTSPVLAVALLGAIAGYAILVATQDVLPGESPTFQMAQPESFRWAVNRAIGAAELTQRAKSAGEWRMVANWWQEAIDLMRQVPKSHTRYDVAQSRIAQYEGNLQYARRKAQEADQWIAGNNLWSIGSRRQEVLDIQGEPSSTERYDLMCREVLRYGKSTVELQNGVIVNYEDFDRNLRATSQATDKAINKSPVWSLGASRDTVFALQGTPTRIVKYDYSQQELLYYGTSTIELTDNRVTGYSNFDNNLRVNAVPAANSARLPYWTLNSTRADLLRVQGTPTQIELDNTTCTETLSYGNSSIQLKNGFITGYNNIDNNLKVQVKD